MGNARQNQHIIIAVLNVIKQIIYLRRNQGMRWSHVYNLVSSKNTYTFVSKSPSIINQTVH